MFMNVIVAVALGLTPVADGSDAVVPASAGQDVGTYRQVIRADGTIRLSGFHRISGQRFDLVVHRDGRVEGVVADREVTFRALRV